MHACGSVAVDGQWGGRGADSPGNEVWGGGTPPPLFGSGPVQLSAGPVQSSDPVIRHAGLLCPV